MLFTVSRRDTKVVVVITSGGTSVDGARPQMFDIWLDDDVISYWKSKAFDKAV